MGCGASSANSSNKSVKRGGTKDTADASLIREIHKAVTKEDRNAVQKLIFPLPRSVQCSLNQKYRSVHKTNLSACHLLAKDFIWHMITAENLPKYQIDYFVKLGFMIDVRQVIDIVATLQPPATATDVFDSKAVDFLLKHFGEEQEILNLVTGRSQLKDSYEVAFGQVNLVNKSRYFAQRIRDLMSNTDNFPQVLYIVIMRCEVDLSDIAVEYESLTSESLWSKLQSFYSHIKLLDHTVPSQIEDKESNSNDSSRAKQCPISKHGSFMDAMISYRDSDEFMKTDDAIYENQREEVRTAELQRACDMQNSPDLPEIKALMRELNETNDIPGLIDIKQVKDIYEMNNVGTTEIIPLSADEEGAFVDSIDEVRVSPSVRDALQTLRRLLAEDTFQMEEVCNVLVAIVRNQDLDVMKTYSDLYQEDLNRSLKEKMTWDAFSVAQYILAGYAKASAILLDRTIQDNDNTTVDLITMILVCSTPLQINEINQAFTGLTNESRNLSDVLAMNLLGEFQRFVGALIQGGRDAKGTLLQTDRAIFDAKNLSRVTDFTWDGEGNVFNEVFVNRSMEQLKLTFQHYLDESGSDITELILQEFSFHLQKALLSIVYIANNGLVKFLAKFLYEAKWKSHLNSVLMWIIATRYSIDLDKVSKEYEQKYNDTIALLIESSTLSPECKTLLVTLSQCSFSAGS